MIATEEMLKKVIIRKGGNLSHAAKEIGITPAAVSKRLNANPELKQNIQEECKKRLEKAGAGVEKIFKRTAEGLDAYSFTILGKKKIPNWKERRESVALCHKLIGNLADVPDGPLSSGQIVVMPIVVVNGNPLQFKVGKNA